MHSCTVDRIEYEIGTMLAAVQHLEYHKDLFPVPVGLTSTVSLSLSLTHIHRRAHA